MGRKLKQRISAAICFLLGVCLIISGLRQGTFVKADLTDSADEKVKYLDVNLYDYSDGFYNGTDFRFNTDKSKYYDTNQESQRTVGIVQNRLGSNKLPMLNTKLTGGTEVELFRHADAEYLNKKMPINYNSKNNMYSFDCSKANVYLESAEHSIMTSAEVSDSAKASKAFFTPLNNMINGNNYYFGMDYSFDFYYPENGKINGDDMIYSFSGDDDVWVFIDGKLVLDIGGIHGAITGTINFRDKTVSYSYSGYETNKNNGSALEGELMKDNEICKTIPLTDPEFGFEPYSVHTLSFFYLERGAYKTTCNFSFNLPLVQDSYNIAYLLEQLDGTYKEADFETARNAGLAVRGMLDIGKNGDSVEINKEQVQTLVGENKTEKENKYLNLCSGEYSDGNLIMPGDTFTYTGADGNSRSVTSATTVTYGKDTDKTVYVVCNLNSYGRTDITVEKKWNCPAEYIRDIDVTIGRMDVYGKVDSTFNPVKLTISSRAQNGSYKATATNLDKYYKTKTSIPYEFAEWTYYVIDEKYSDGTDSTGLFDTSFGTAALGEIVIANALKAQTTLVHVEKKWKRLDGPAPKVEITLQSKNENGEYEDYIKDGSKVSVILPIVMDGAESYSYTFAELPKYDKNNSQIEYYAVEKLVEPSTKYEQKCAPIISDNGSTITFVNGLKDKAETSLTGKKTWIGDEGEGVRPASIKVKLEVSTNGGESYRDYIPEGSSDSAVATVSADSNWRYEFINLPAYKLDADGNYEYAYKYRAVEIDTDKNYTVSYSENEIINTLNKPVTVVVNKTWDDQGMDLSHPDLTFTLRRNGIEIAKKTLKNNETSCIFDNLLKYDSEGKAYEYTVDEENVSDYVIASVKRDTESDGNKIIYSIKNRYNKSAKIVIKKIWKQPAGLAKPTITLRVDRDWQENDETLSEKDVIVSTVKGIAAGVPEEGRYILTYDGIAYAKNVSGSAIEYNYTVSEDKLDGYRTNIYKEDNVWYVENIISKNIDITVNKSWISPSSISNPNVTVMLTRSSDSELAEDASWSATEVIGSSSSAVFSNLPKYDSEGQLYNYTVSEIKVGEVEAESSGYHITSITQPSEANSYTASITNEYNMTYSNISVNKKWLDPDASLRKPVTVVLRKTVSGSTTNTDSKVILSDANNWSASFDSLPDYDASWNRITYDVVEEGQIEGYRAGYVVANGEGSFTVINEINQGQVDFPVTKIWIDPAGTNHAPIELELYKKGAESMGAAETESLVTAVSWDTDTYVDEAGHRKPYVFTGLTKYDANGQAYKYYVKEKPVAGYTSSFDESGHILTNTIKQSYITIKGVKKWAELPNDYTKGKVKFRLYRNDMAEAISELTLGGEYSYDGYFSRGENIGAAADKVDSIPAELMFEKYNPVTGEEYVYTVEEEELTDFTSDTVMVKGTDSVYNSENIEFTITNTYKDYYYKVQYNYIDIIYGEVYPAKQLLLDPVKSSKNSVVAARDVFETKYQVYEGYTYTPGAELETDTVTVTAAGIENAAIINIYLRRYVNRDNDNISTPTPDAATPTASVTPDDSTITVEVGTPTPNVTQPEVTTLSTPTPEDNEPTVEIEDVFPPEDSPEDTPTDKLTGKPDKDATATPKPNTDNDKNKHVKTTPTPTDLVDVEVILPPEGEVSTKPTEKPLDPENEVTGDEEKVDPSDPSDPLPETGTIPSIVFYISGGAMFLIGGVLLFASRKKEEDESI